MVSLIKCCLLLSYCFCTHTHTHNSTRFEYWFTAVSFAIIIFMYDETRKLILRRHPGGITNYGGYTDTIHPNVVFVFSLQAGWKEKLITDNNI